MDTKDLKAHTHEAIHDYADRIYKTFPDIGQCDLF